MDGDKSAMNDNLETSTRVRPSVTLCLLYTSDAADERSSVDLGGRRIIKKKKQADVRREAYHRITTK